MKFKTKHFLLIVFFISIINSIVASCSEPVKTKYKFINQNINEFTLYGDSDLYKNLFCKFYETSKYKKGTINIVHIGDSHIQADIYTAYVRQKLQNFLPNLSGSRGCIFPYSIAKSNNPSNYKIIYTGEWEFTDVITNNTRWETGLNGVSVATCDPLSTIKIILKSEDKKRNFFNKVTIYCKKDSIGIYPYILPYINNSIENDSENKIEYYLNEPTDSVTFSFSTDSAANPFILHHFNLQNDSSGVLYHSFGFNGNSVKSVLKEEQLNNQLSALHPDWIIISLGTNDGYTKNLDTSLFRINYELLLKLITSTAPDVPILLITPNDNYRYKKYSNQSNAKIELIINKLSAKYGLSVWNFYKIMGGYKSINSWVKNSLAKSDKVHFTEKGYILQGELFFQAFQKAYNQFEKALNNNL